MGRRGRGGMNGGSRSRGGTAQNLSNIPHEYPNGFFNAPRNHSYHQAWDGNGPSKLKRIIKMPGDLPNTQGSSKSHLSLSEEARNTERHHTWNSDLKLRHSRISFVSAGTSKAEELTQLPQAKMSECGGYSQELKSNAIAKNSPRPLTVDSLVPKIPMSSMSLNESRFGDTTSEVCRTPAHEEFRKMDTHGVMTERAVFIDINGSDSPLQTAFPTPQSRRSQSPAASDSSEEVILFAGRYSSHTKESRNNSTAEQVESKPEIPYQGSSFAADHRSKHTRTTADASRLVETQRAKTPTANETPTTTATVFSPPGESKSGRSTKQGRRRRHKQSQKYIREAEILDDYIANACDDGVFEGSAEVSGLNLRDLGGSDAEQWENEEQDSKVEPRLESSALDAEGWDSADLQDFDDISTSSEIPVGIESILAKRERPSGLQYLVVEPNSTCDDARWLPVDSLRTSNVLEKIRDFEERKVEIEQLRCKSDNGSDEDLTVDEMVASEQREHLDDREERWKERMTDEQIARMLSKQEELGLGSNDLVLFDGDHLAGDGIEAAQLDGPLGRPVSFTLPSRLVRKKIYQPTFPSAASITDVLDQDPYNGFDIMDHERPSLRKKPKGRRGKLALDISDSELEQLITMAWDNDRVKKKIRKREREELRAQGLLGTKGRVDIKAKYSEGMSMNQAKAEIRDFLLSSLESLPLPPMAQKERKLIHEIANVFKLKSKSIGSGKSRYPVLYKTARTNHYDEAKSGSINAILSSTRFLPQLDKVKARGSLTGRARSGYANAGVSYRDGEVVGATAPELGQENKGRAMLEKMGWSTGKALGALNNTRGIVQPVTQVVKTGKTGLG